MARIPTAEVSLEVLNYLFDELDIWTKIQNGRLTSEPKPGSHTPSYVWRNATSMIIKHSQPDGKHVATTHCIKHDDSGDVLHWDAKDLIVGEVRLFRS